MESFVSKISNLWQTIITMFIRFVLSCSFVRKNQQMQIRQRKHSTMLQSDRVLQQQYRAHNYQLYSQLIHKLTLAEKHDELLLKNHHKRPVGLAPLPEVHNVQKILGISSMDLFQRTKLVKANTIGDKGLIQTRGRRTMRNPKMTISVIDVEIFRILPRIAVHLSIQLLCTKNP